MTPDGGPAAAVLLLHGIGDRIVYWRAAQERMAKSGVCSLIFGYAGYGESEGKTSRENLEADAHAAYAWLRSRIPEPIPVYVLGFSLGTGLAAEIGPALMPPPAGIIMAEAFTTLRLAAKRVVLGLPLVANLLPDVWRTRENVTRLRVPLLIIHSNGDALFPRSMADEIYAAARAGGAPAELAVFESYRHNAPYLSVPEDYWAAILDFLHRHAPVTAARAD